MAKTILNFHFDYWNPSLIQEASEMAYLQVYKCPLYRIHAQSFKYFDDFIPHSRVVCLLNENGHILAVVHPAFKFLLASIVCDKAKIANFAATRSPYRVFLKTESAFLSYCLRGPNSKLLISAFHSLLAE